MSEINILTLRGIIIEGLGGSNIWMKNYMPSLYPGTLNVLLDTHRPDIQWHSEYTITDGNLQGKKIKIGNCYINDIPALVIKPPDFNYKKRPNWVEIGHTEKLRNILKLKTGDGVSVKFTHGTKSVIKKIVVNNAELY